MLNEDLNRRGFLHCMRWAGTGLLWTVTAGVPVSRLLGEGKKRDAAEGFSFIQISDSHIGFNSIESNRANPDVSATLQETIAKINATPEQPEFLIHTGDITHFAKPGEFDTASGILKSAKTKDIFYVPGEHDVLSDQGKRYQQLYGRSDRTWYSFDHKGVHFIGLTNVLGMKEGWGMLGDEQLMWLENDLAGKSSSTPIVVFAHIPLWAIYPQWGWVTGDSERALAALKRFGSVTVLNGHIHQILQKVEGNVTFHTAMSTAFPQPKPGAAPSPGPMKVPLEQLRSMLGLTSVKFVRGEAALAVIDSTLAP